MHVADASLVGDGVTAQAVASWVSYVIAGITVWWAQFGKTPPDWFALRADGKRGLKVPRAGAWTPLCVSNSEMQRFLVEKAWDGGGVLTLGEADAAGGRPELRLVPGAGRFHDIDQRLLLFGPRTIGGRLARHLAAQRRRLWLRPFW